MTEPIAKDSQWFVRLPGRNIPLRVRVLEVTEDGLKVRLRSILQAKDSPGEWYRVAELDWVREKVEKVRPASTEPKLHGSTWKPAAPADPGNVAETKRRLGEKD